MSQGQSSTCNSNSTRSDGRIDLGFIRNNIRTTATTSTTTTTTTTTTDLASKYHNRETGGPSCSIKPEFFRPPFIHKDLQKLRNLFNITAFKNGFFSLESIDDWEETGKLEIHQSCCCKVISEETDSYVIQELKRNDEDYFVDQVDENRDLEDALLNMKF